MINLFRRYSISILNKDWQPMTTPLRLKHVPRQGELIFFEQTNQYYKVLNVVHNLTKKQGIFVVVDVFGEQIPKG